MLCRGNHIFSGVGSARASKTEVLVRTVTTTRKAHTIRLHFRRPQYNVVAQQVENHERVPERMLRRGMHAGDGLVERVLREVARAVGAAAHVMEEDREVERDAEAGRVPRRQRAKRMLVRRLVRLEREQRRALTLLPPCELCEVPVVVALPVKNAVRRVR